MKRLLLFFLATILLLSMTAGSGYNRIMREHLGNEDNYYDVDAVFCSYKKVDDRIYLYVSIEDKSAFDSSESNSEELELVGDNCDILDECLANNEIREGDKITVKCSTWIYMDSTFYYIAEIKGQEKTFLSFDDGMKNIVRYMGDNKSLF